MNLMKRSALTPFMLAFAFTLACNSYEIDKANKLVDATNVLIETANKNADEAGTKLGDMNSKVGAVEEEDQLEALRAQAKEIIPLMEKARDGYKDAAAKFDEASKLKLPEKYKEYLSAKAQELKKRADSTDAAIGQPKAMQEIKSPEEYQPKAQAVVDKMQAASKEADDFKAKAEKIYQENKALFKE
ncbi:MAG: hypothetical protein AB1757_09180 [Acidobacteriota bacterium]